jgi:hypothetical protein
MKLAGILALVLAAVVGIWAGRDFARNEQERQLDVKQAEWAESCCSAVHDSAMLQADEAERHERFDGIMGIVAAVALIGGIAMISQRATQSVHPPRPSPIA